MGSLGQRRGCTWATDEDTIKILFWTVGSWRNLEAHCLVTVLFFFLSIGRSPEFLSAISLECGLVAPPGLFGLSSYSTENNALMNEWMDLIMVEYVFPIAIISRFHKNRMILNASPFSLHFGSNTAVRSRRVSDEKKHQRAFYDRRCSWLNEYFIILFLLIRGRGTEIFR